jgi:hypothetical protein
MWDKMWDKVWDKGGAAAIGMMAIRIYHNTDYATYGGRVQRSSP